MVELRPLLASDVEDLYAISLATGHWGGDAANLYDDPNLMGHIYSAPYASLEPGLCFVAEDNQGVAGFVVGTLDTYAFELALEKYWWPSLRVRYPAPDIANSASWSADEKRCQMIQFPNITPKSITVDFPGHLHLNILPRLQGQGVGKALLRTWEAAAKRNSADAAHVGVNPMNHNAIRFWNANGFRLLNGDLGLPSDRTLWLGRQLIC